MAQKKDGFKNRPQKTKKHETGFAVL